jgi:hypothetical protein
LRKGKDIFGVLVEKVPNNLFAIALIKDQSSVLLSIGRKSLKKYISVVANKREKVLYVMELIKNCNSMNMIPTIFRQRFRNSFMALAPVLLLTACSTEMDTDLGGIFTADTPPPPCPTVEVLPGANEITLFREGLGRDLVDVEFEGIIQAVGGECLYKDDETKIEIDLTLRILLVQGPAAKTKGTEFVYFVAIADRDKRILAKKKFASPVEVKEGGRRGGVIEEIEQVIPLASGRSGPDYVILIGFQLNNEQYRFNVEKSK